MGEVSTQSINGLVVNKGGISFTFSNPAGNLFYNQSNGGTLTYVQDPTIEGGTSAFGVAFSAPVYTVQFGLAVSTSSPVATMATVALFYNSTTAFATFPLGSSLTDPFAEGQFTYNGALGPVTNILITPTGTGFTALGFDNLTVTTSPIGVAVPAASPLTLALTGICLAGLTLLLLRKRAA